MPILIGTSHPYEMVAQGFTLPVMKDTGVLKGNFTIRNPQLHTNLESILLNIPVSKNETKKPHFHSFSEAEFERRFGKPYP